MSEMDEIIREFLVESNEGLDQMDRDLVELEKKPDCKELLAGIFRAVHTIKGTSGVLGFQRSEAVAHVGENLLSRVRDGKLRLTGDMTTVLLAMADALRTKLREIESTGQEAECDDSRIIAAVSSFLSTEVAEGNATHSASPRIGEILVQAGVAKAAVSEALREQGEGDSRLLGEILVSKRAANPEEVLDALNKQAEPHASAASSNIRVHVALLDKVMDLVGELVLSRNELLQWAAVQKEPTFLRTAQRLNLITTELQEAVMKTRMQPIGNVWNKFPRLVRDLAAGCGKQVRIELYGSETELDKTIIEAIKDPLTHIVRNAIDHGIETPEERRANGKESVGRLLLRAFHEGGQVNIEIEDDGTGINVSRVKGKVISQGLLTEDQVAGMTEREAMNLIFLPGLSTADKVTNISGRGVGMDVVRTNIEKIGGIVDVQSIAGRGTSLKIRIPLTLAIIPALVITSGGERFAVPQIGLVELVRLNNDHRGIETIHGVPVYRLRGNLLPLVFLARELNIEHAAANSGAVNIVVLQADRQQFGLVVDEINDTEEIVVKPLGKHLKGVSCLAGATIMGDGRVALILDVAGLAQKAKLTSNASDVAGVEDRVRDGRETAATTEQWLVFKAGAANRMAVPLSSVGRLEEIKPGAIERAGSHEVVQYRGQIMPLVRFAARMPHDGGQDEQRPMQVIVYAQNGRSVGLVVDEIVDVVEQNLILEHDASKQPGILGSAVIQKQVTDLIDIPALIAAHVQGWWPSPCASGRGV